MHRWSVRLPGNVVRVTVGICYLCLSFCFPVRYLHNISSHLLWDAKLQCDAVMHCDALWCTAMHCDAYWKMLAPTFIQWDAVMHWDSLWCTVDNVLAPTLTVRCKTAPWCFTRRGWRPSFTRWSTMICIKYNSSKNTNTNTTHLSFTRWSTSRKIQSKNNPSLCILHGASFPDHMERYISVSKTQKLIGLFEFHQSKKTGNIESIKGDLSLW